MAVLGHGPMSLVFTSRFVSFLRSSLTSFSKLTEVAQKEKKHVLLGTVRSVRALVLNA
jgi:hypothetical protein